jgi:hypothetical protein
MGNNKKVIDWKKTGLLEGLSEFEAAECSIFLDNTSNLLALYKEYEPLMKFEYKNALPMARRFYSQIRKVYDKDFLEIANSRFYKGVCLDSTKLHVIPGYDAHHPVGDFIFCNLGEECDWVAQTVDERIVKAFLQTIEHKQMCRHYNKQPPYKKMYLYAIWIMPIVGTGENLGSGFDGAFLE